MAQIIVVVFYLFCFLFPGILNDDGSINNDASCLRLAEIALAYAQAGEPSCLSYMIVPNFDDGLKYIFVVFFSLHKALIAIDYLLR